jgi:hypothetical protein
MFPTLRSEVTERFDEVEAFFQQSCRLRGELSKTSRGLAFVQIYAIHEYTVVTAVRHAGVAVAARAHPFIRLRPSLLPFFLTPELQSVQDSIRRGQWESRLALFEKATSRDPAVFLGTPTEISHDSHFRYQHIELIFRVFGINRAVTRRRRYRGLIDEVVNRRNEIAHGNSTAAEVGRNYTNADIRLAIRRMKSICLRLVQMLEEYCSDPAKHCR